MSWNYRIVRYADGDGFGLHEVRYDANGKAISMTSAPAGFVGDTEEDIREALLRARMDSVKRPVFDEPIEWTTTPDSSRGAV